MAGIRSGLQSGLQIFSNFVTQGFNYGTSGFQQVRNKYANRWMTRDVKRRQLAEKYAEERLRLVVMKRNNILPREIIDLVGKEIDEKIPRQTALRQLTYRCVLTSRPRGVVQKWRLSRIVFRDLADHNLMAGVQRAMW